MEGTCGIILFASDKRRESALGYRSTVGRLTLDQLIGVRIPAPQSGEVITASPFLLFTNQ